MVVVEACVAVVVLMMVCDGCGMVVVAAACCRRCDGCGGLGGGDGCGPRGSYCVSKVFFSVKDLKVGEDVAIV